MRRWMEYLFFWITGGCLYYSFELMFRGFSHISMFVLGGVCFLFFFVQGKMVGWKDPLWRQVLRCTVFVTAAEFITGMIVNKWLQLHVWDYSRLPFQLFGQICLQFTVIFSGLCAAGIILSGYLGYWLFGEEKPQYHVF